MNKLEFEDKNRDYGYVEYVDGEMDWYYEGEIEEVYEHMFSQEGMTGHGRPEDATSEGPVDELTEFTPQEKISGIIRRFRSDSKIWIVKRNGERIY